MSTREQVLKSEHKATIVTTLIIIPFLCMLAIVLASWEEMDVQQHPRQMDNVRIETW